MGSSCSSVHRSQQQTTNIMKLRTKSNLAIPPSPINDKDKKSNNNGNLGVALKPRWPPSPPSTTTTFNGSKEEAFFDSKAWLDSDCEDDFYSVNGDFTPSRGTTPVHHAFGAPVVNKTPSDSLVPGSAAPDQPSPTEKKKSLLELFRESVREPKDNDDEKKQVKQNIQDLLLPKSARSTPYTSGATSACSSERTSNHEDPPYITEKPVKSVQCCLSRLASCHGFSKRRRKASTPITANGKA